MYCNISSQCPGMQNCFNETQQHCYMPITLPWQGKRSTIVLHIKCNTNNLTEHHHNEMNDHQRFVQYVLVQISLMAVNPFYCLSRVGFTKCPPNKCPHVMIIMAYWRMRTLCITTHICCLLWYLM